MRHFWKKRTIVITLLFFSMGVRIDALNLRGAYQKAKNAATSVTTAVKGAAISVTKTVGNVLSVAAKTVIKSDQTAIRLNSYKDTVATVRIGNELHPDERAYLTHRKPKVKNALEGILGRSLRDEQVPTIALVGSGGGYRAMLTFLGVVAALDQIGLWNSITYVSALSGSTWTLAPLVSTGMSIPEYKNYLTQTIVNNIHVSTVREAKNILDMLMVKIAFDEPLTMVDMYGGLLGNRLLNFYGTDCQRVYLSQQAERIKNADLPFPIYTAVDAREAVALNPHWIEFTPYEIGIPYFGMYVPTWSYGRKFNAGRSIDFAPEQSLGFHLGTFGSAFGVHCGRAWEEIVEQVSSTTIKAFIKSQLIDPYSSKRINATWAEIFNFMYGMPNQELTHHETLKFVDAGTYFNLPYPPISGERPERKADIIIFVDASRALPDEFKKTENYARRKGLKFPSIDYTDIAKKTVSIFKDSADPSVPVLIYLPRISDAQLWDACKLDSELSKYSSIANFDFEASTNGGGFCRTGNFQYTQQQSQQVIDQMEFNVLANKNVIIKAINEAIDNKK